MARQAQVEAEGEGWRLPPPADLTHWGIVAEEDVTWVRSKLVQQPFKTVTQPLRLANPAGFGGPKTFIACVEAPAAGSRDAMIERVRAWADSSAVVAIAWRLAAATTILSTAGIRLCKAVVIRLR